MRFIRIFVCTILCVMFFLSGTFLLAKGSKIESALEPIGAAIFLLFFLLPYTVPGIAVLLLVLSLMDLRGLRRPWHYVVAWVIVGGWIVVLPQGSDWARLLGALPVLAVTGVVYWALAGRVAGEPEYLLSDYFNLPLATQLAIWACLVIAAIAATWILTEALKTIGPM